MDRRTVGTTNPGRCREVAVSRLHFFFISSTFILQTKTVVSLQDEKSVLTVPSLDVRTCHQMETPRVSVIMDTKEKNRMARVKVNNQHQHLTSYYNIKTLPSVPTSFPGSLSFSSTREEKEREPGIEVASVQVMRIKKSINWDMLPRFRVGDSCKTGCTFRSKRL